MKNRCTDDTSKHKSAAGDTAFKVKVLDQTNKLLV